MAFDLANLLHCFDLEDLPDGRVRGANYDLAYRRIFGGQLLGQSIAALHRSGGGKEVKSLTQHFTREGDPRLAVDLSIAAINSGRTFATATVTASQQTEKGERVIGALLGSLHTPEDGPHRSDPHPALGRPEDAVARASAILPWEVRVADDLDLTDPTLRPARYQLWMRIPDLPQSGQWLHQALLAHATESMLIGTALFPLEGISQADAGAKFTSAVLSHSLWFHAPVAMDQWLLVDHHSPLMSGGRVFGRADVWNAEGDLIASLAQESMVRMLPAS